VSKLERVTGFRPLTSLDVIVHDVVADQRARFEASAGDSTRVLTAR
jgi:hypothetical protein